MSNKAELKYNDFKRSLKKLSSPELLLLKNEINLLLDEESKVHSPVKKLTREKILKGPVMNDEEFERVNKVIKDLNEWKIPNSY